MAVRAGHPQSRDAETWYEVQERFDGFTLVKLAPKTGRTHQIRVHLAHIGAPVLCDRLYAGQAQITRGQLARRMLKRQPPQPGDDEVVLARQALHARRLELEHPMTGQRLTFESPIPADIAATLSALRQA
ncbi:MAG: pseudouridine synthase, partial [Aureliella sp.]